MTDAVTLIRAKRDGHRLSDDDIGWLFGAYAKGEVADEQMSALLMAIYFQGLDGAELRTWTAAMIAISSADICSSATSPFAYAPNSHPMSSPESRCPSRLALISVTASVTASPDPSARTGPR